ncbi:WD40-repeat-containing domain [Pseudocohnilembus persalinus]|uniref:WD40-repeat-containing domain n=1 Tax=Pseudocohnilembus persalinus TaxID=266149 RepID=A0A0V0QD53_PSEPJ|nr:WD40-repeat-containing domain [Pseudocohnilembus persalinus]|eukprot:KRX00056.1 WD40-repeat-containing domain [Pseudocohnilembus persalinus]
MQQQNRILGGILGQVVHTTEKTVTVNYSQKISTYNKQSKKIIFEIDNQFNSQIVHFRISSNQLFAIDKSGLIKSFNYDPDTTSQISQNISANYEKQLDFQIASAQFDHLSENLYFLTTTNQLFHLSLQSDTLKKISTLKTAENIEKIEKTLLKLSQSEDLLFISLNKSLFIFSLDQQNNGKIFIKQIKKINHPNLITQFAVSNDDEVLAIGDFQGKITQHKNFLAKSQISVQHWHSTAVTALEFNLQRSVLYSGGGEGVLVVWQQFEDKRDFYPRIGTQITHLQIEQNQNCLTILLKENVIKTIKLHNFAEDLCLQNITNPLAQKTLQQDLKLKQNQQIIAFQAGFQQNQAQNLIATNSLPGRLQIIDLFAQQKKRDLDVVYRNLTSKSDKQTPNPQDITAFKFDSTFKILCAASQSEQQDQFSNTLSSLRFLEEKDQNGQFELITKIEKPHGEKIYGVQNYFSVSQMSNIFITYGSDNKIKFWKKFKAQTSQKRQQQEDSVRYYWNCYREENYKDEKIIKLQAFNIQDEQEEKTQEILNILTENTFLQFNVTQNKVTLEFNLPQTQPQKLPLDFIFLEDSNQTFILFQNQLQVLNLTQKSTTLTIPLENALNIVNHQSQIFVLLTLLEKQKSVIISLNSDLKQDIQINLYDQIFDQILIVKQNDSSSSLLAVDQTQAFQQLKTLNSQTKAKTSETENNIQNNNQNENQNNNQNNNQNENSNNNFSSKLEFSKIQHKKNFQTTFQQHLEINLRQENQHLFNFFPSNSHAIPPANLLFNQFLDKFLVSNSKQQQKYQNLLKTNQDQKKSQKNSEKIKNNSQFLMETESESENENENEDKVLFSQKQSEYLQKSKNNNPEDLNEKQFKDLQTQINSIFSI